MDAKAIQSTTAAEDQVSLVRGPIDAAAVMTGLAAAGSGAVVTFWGTVREEARGKKVIRLEYTAYEDMASMQMAELVRQAREKFALKKVRLIHRLGELGVGETSVFIGVAAAHRQEAFAGCRFLIDGLKQTVPIWKKEHYEDGQSWIEGEAPTL